LKNDNCYAESLLIKASSVQSGIVSVNFKDGYRRNSHLIGLHAKTMIVTKQNTRSNPVIPATVVTSMTKGF